MDMHMGMRVWMSTNSYCPQPAIDSLIWVGDKSTAGTKLSQQDLEFIFRSKPHIRVVLAAFPGTATKIIAAATAVRPSGVSDLRITCYDENKEVRDGWMRGQITVYQRTQRTDFEHGLVPALVNFVPALLSWRIGAQSKDADQNQTAAVNLSVGRRVGYFSSLPRVLRTPVFLISNTPEADLRAAKAKFSLVENPLAQGNVPMSVSLLVEAIDLDTGEGLLKLRLAKTVKWHDWRLVWDKRWSVDSLDLTTKAVWRPGTQADNGAWVLGLEPHMCPFF